ncbi:MAG: M15 family metallopeptidase, partial [Actinobacteria bacterium]|nr:M15 family metallopeptidase [Actinomycetota bacterium]
LYRVRYPIRQMRPVDAYGGSDFQSIEHDNTSSFNCRAATGSSNWSNHAYGLAIDVNPIENPYVSVGRTSHPDSVRYLNRSKHLPGMIHPGDVVVRAFEAIGWGWGGYWSGSVQDLQHFSSNGH